jgi:hypothetical protein
MFPDPVALSNLAGLHWLLIDFAQKPSWVLNWRSSQPAEKTAEERRKMVLKRQGARLSTGELIRLRMRSKPCAPARYDR